MRALLFLLLRRMPRGLNFNQFVRDSHRKSGVFSFLVLLSPVDSCNPPELKELTSCLYARGMCSASKKKRKAKSPVSRAYSADWLVDFPCGVRAFELLSTRSV
jgi:hypothetical protein